MSRIETAELFRILLSKIEEELIIPKHLCEELIGLCEDSGIAILGFDGYKALELNPNSISDISDLKKNLSQSLLLTKKSQF